MKKVAVLFADPTGSYSGIDWVDLWDEDRDARKYCGSLPVVAHPPCQLWGNLAFVNYKRWGGEHNKPGNDNGCFESALSSVRRCGGVLEHPAGSKAFFKYLNTKPSDSAWQLLFCGGWVCEVWQSAYGHKANKATWLYYYGKNAPPLMKVNRPIGTHQIGHSSKIINKPILRGKHAIETPIEFRDKLLSIAINSGDKR